MSYIRKNRGQIILHFIFIAICMIYILPFILVISVSISSENTVKVFGYTLFPKVISLDAYKSIFANPGQILQGYKITIMFTVMTTILSTIVMTLVAYPMSRRNYKLRNLLTFYVFFTMLFSGGLVPSYIINSKILHLDNTIWIYIIPGLVSAWNVILIRTFFQGLPESLVESAKLDGASELRTYFQIIMPLSTPVVATVAFMTVVAKWNDWNTALIYIRDQNLYSLQYLLQKILRETEFVKKMAAETGMLSNVDTPTETMKFALAMVAAGPVLVVFPFFQKYFAEGLTIGAIKG